MYAMGSVKLVGSVVLLLVCLRPAVQEVVPAPAPEPSPDFGPSPGPAYAPPYSAPSYGPTYASPPPTYFNSPVPSPETCGLDALTERGGFDRSGIRYNQRQNVLFSFMAVGSHVWFWGVATTRNITSDAAYNECMNHWGVEGALMTNTTDIPGDIPGETTAYVMRTDKDVFTVFRPTDSDGDWDTNYKFFLTDGGDLFGVANDSVRLHSGFRAAYLAVDEWYLQSVEAQLRTLPSDAKIWVIGYSLGGALSQIAALRLAATYGSDRIGGVFLMGAPRVGNQGWRDLYNPFLGEKTLRVKAGTDPNSSLPPMLLGYRDVGTGLALCPNDSYEVVSWNDTNEAHGDWGCAGTDVIFANSALHKPMPYILNLQRRFGDECTARALELDTCNLLENCATSPRLLFRDLCTTCFTDADCAKYYPELPGAYCDNLALNRGNFTCELPTVPLGGDCSFDQECISGSCTALSRCEECEDDEDCPAGTYCEGSIFGYNQCLPVRQTGSACSRDAQCLVGQCQFFTCQECSEDSQCPEDKYCETSIFATVNKWNCMPRLPNGSLCTRDRQCQNICVFSFFPPARCGFGYR